MRKILNVLVACECSGEVRRAFRALGHNAWSCDWKPAEDNAKHHMGGDACSAIAAGARVLRFLDPVEAGILGARLLDKPWDLLIMHPPCTRMALSGALRMYRGGKKANGLDPQKVLEQEAALQFARDLIMYAGETPWCIENPASIISTRIRPKDQEIQPYEFGHDASKKTWLWLSKLPPLRTDPKKYIRPRWVCQKCGHTQRIPSRFVNPCEKCQSDKLLPRWSNQTDSGQNRLAPSEKRATDRARTYPGIAKAMAEQWSTWILNHAN